MLALAFCAGCDRAGHRKILERKSSAREYMIVAVSDADPDVRREAVARVADSSQTGTDWAVDGFVTIALLDTDTQARCVAVRGLAKSGDARGVDALVKILSAAQHPPTVVRPPGDALRADAATALTTLSERGRVPGELQPVAREALLGRLKLDPIRHVRIAAARGLANYPSADTLKALVDGLADADFAVVHRCEESLIRLTGVTHRCDRSAWSAWLEAHADDAFAQAGQTPESRKPPYKTPIGEFGYKTWRLWRTVFPPSKED